MKRALLLSAFVLLPLGASAADLTARALEGFSTCVSRFPESRETVGVLKSQGWRYEGLAGKFHLYSDEGRRVIAAATVTSARQKGCAVAVSKMTAEQAVAVAQAFLQGQKAERLADPKEADEDAVAAWTLKVNGHNVGLAAMQSEDFGIMRGAGLILVELK